MTFESTCIKCGDRVSGFATTCSACRRQQSTEFHAQQQTWLAEEQRRLAAENNNLAVQQLILERERLEELRKQTKLKQEDRISPEEAYEAGQRVTALKSTLLTNGDWDLEFDNPYETDKLKTSFRDGAYAALAFRFPDQSTWLDPLFAKLGEIAIEKRNLFLRHADDTETITLFREIGGTYIFNEDIQLKIDVIHINFGSVEINLEFNVNEDTGELTFVNTDLIQTNVNQFINHFKACFDYDLVLSVVNENSKKTSRLQRLLNDKREKLSCELERLRKVNVRINTEHGQGILGLVIAASGFYALFSFGYGFLNIGPAAVLWIIAAVVIPKNAFTRRTYDVSETKRLISSITAKLNSLERDSALKPQGTCKEDKIQEPIVPQENYSWRREEAVVDSKQKKNKNTLPIFLGITVIVAAVFWRLGSETGGTAEKKDKAKPFTTKPYSQLRAEMGKEGWQPYIARDNKDQCDLKYQEVSFCSEDLSCTAEFLDGSHTQIAKFNFRICKSAITNCVSWGEYPDGFELVVSKELKSLKTPVETYVCDL